MTMKWLNEEICEELEGAKTYIKKAAHCKQEGNTKNADVFYTMSTQELGHAENLMEMAKELVEENKSEMTKELWDYLRCKAEDEYHEAAFSDMALS